jgi:phosphinothricin acetyltransferase
MNIRPAKVADTEQVAEIYNFYILNAHHTFETEPVTSKEMQKRIDKIIKNYPCLGKQVNNIR